MTLLSFFGHFNTPITEQLIVTLRNLIEDLIVNQDFGLFYFGGFGNFDNLCYKIVSELKIKYPHIRRIFCFSDPRHENPIKRPQWLRNQEYEEFVYLKLQYDYWYTRIYYRNCAMIDDSDFVIFYSKNRERSGAYKAYKYALKHKKRLINLAQ